jgi:hypothetical protein
MLIINKDRALELLEQVVEGHEDFVYRADERDEYLVPTVDCVYVEAGKPSCLVAQALHAGGATIGQLAEMDDSCEDSGIGSVDMPSGLLVTQGAREVFGVAQSSQDYGKPWGDCLNEAIEVHRKATNP